MKILHPRKVKMIEELLDFGMSKVKICRLVKCSRMTAIRVERGEAGGHYPSQIEIAVRAAEIRAGWSAKTMRNRRIKYRAPESVSVL